MSQDLLLRLEQRISCHELGSAHLDTWEGSSRKLIGASDQQEQALVQLKAGLKARLACYLYI